MPVQFVIAHKPRLFAALAIVVASALLSGGAAHGQIYGAPYVQPAPLYPYVVQPNQSAYVVPMQQGAYIIQVPAAAPHARRHPARHKHAADVASSSESVAGKKFDHPHKPVDPTLVEDLRKHGRGHIETKVLNTTKIVREKPIVIEKKRYVNDPPIVIERRHVVEDTLPGEQSGGKRATRGASGVRVIRAEAEVTILGPDRMNIRLFRRRGTDANAKAE